MPLRHSDKGAAFLAGLNFPEPLREALSRRVPTHGPAIKICGLSTPATLACALDAGTDLVGFVFFSRSPRHLALEAAAHLAIITGLRAVKVALVVDADDEALEAIVSRVGPDMLQLHGHESPQRVVEIKARFGLPVLKAIGVSGPSDLAAVGDYADVADRLLFDAKPPAGADLPGGNGLAFDWDLLKDVGLKTPFMLSGGLDARNVVEAAVRTGAGAVDVSSGVESAPGQKDASKIAAFVRTLRSASGDIETLGSDGATR
jgi:phosphoribosylanthranilate isomerase